MAADIFLKLTDTKGESMADGHKDEIEVLSWSWGASNEGSAERGSGLGSGKVHFGDMNLTKLFDKSSPKLMLHCSNGKHLGEALLCARKSGGGEKPHDYLKIKMTDLVVSSFQVGGAGEGGYPTESFSLNFSKIEFEYYAQDSKGNVSLAGSSSYDLKKTSAKGA